MNMSQLAIETLCEIVLDLQKRVSILEEENVGTNNMLYELSIDIDMLKERLKTLENLVIGDNK